MGILLSFSIASAIILACLYLAYRWTMANERQFSLNRATLYLIYAISFFSALGFNKIAGLFHTPATEAVPSVIIDIEGMTSGIIGENAQPLWLTVVLWIYAAGVCFVSLRFIAAIIKIAHIIRKGKNMGNYGKYRLIVVPDSNVAPFSCMRYIVISEADYYADHSPIITHELTHLRNRHWIDLVIANLVAIFQWFNPAAWLMIEEFKTIHEYQADDSVIRSGADIKQYQYLLIEKAVGERLPSPANSLNHSKLKKRVTMMYKSKPRTLRRVASLATIPALFAGIALVNSSAVASVLSDAEDASLLPVYESASVIAESLTDSEPMHLIAVLDDKVTKNPSDSEAPASENDLSVSAATHSDEATASDADRNLADASGSAPESTASADDKKKEPIYVAVEEMAEFPGGQNEMMKFLAMNVRYPENAMKNDIQGRVIVKFIISKTGKVEDPVVVKGVDPELDAEAIRVVKAMPNWVPAKCDGKPVASYFNIPISFKLEDDESKDSTANQPAAVVVKAFK